MRVGYGIADGIIFLEGVQFTVCPIMMILKKHPSIYRNGNSVQIGLSIIEPVCTLSSFLFITFPVSRLFPLPSACRVQALKGERFSG